jgi:NADPH:quinone reductase-like Zn-dependent oxidoreductase
MEAIQYSSYKGGAAGLKRVQLPIPEPKKGEIVVKVEAISLNPFDWKIQAANVRPFLPSKFPFTPCTDIAGEVIKVASDVKNFKVGDKVVAMLPPPNGGGLAEYAAVKATQAVIRPHQVSAAEGASLATAPLTAYQALTGSGGLPKDGSMTHIKNILITAASGGVGHLAVQLAKILAPKSHVTATAGARNIEFVLSLGADEVIDYKTPEGKTLQSPSGKKYDLVVDCAAAGTPWSTFSKVMSEKSKIVFLDPSPKNLWTLIVRKITLSKKKVGILFTAQKSDELEFLVNLIKDEKLRVKIDTVYPFSKAEDAWAKSIDGHATGKIIVET